MSIKGMDSLLRKINSLDGNSQQMLKTAVLQATKKVQGDAKDLAPVDTGRLRNSIQATVEEKDGEIIGKVSTNVEYATYIEFGTGKRGEESPSPPKSPEGLNYREDWIGIPAQPFLYPAAAQNKETVPKIVSAHLKKEIRKLVK